MAEMFEGLQVFFASGGLQGFQQETLDAVEAIPTEHDAVRPMDHGH